MNTQRIDRIIRIGNVSSIDADAGTAAVTYPDMNDDTTIKLSTFAGNDEYKMPLVGDRVLVLHLPNGECAAFVMGHYWNKKYVSPHTGERVFHKELLQQDKWGKAYIDYDDDTETLTIWAPKIRIVSDCMEHGEPGSIIMESHAGGTIKLDSTTLELVNETTTNTGVYNGEKDGVAGTTDGPVRLLTHTHGGHPQPDR